MCFEEVPFRLAFRQVCVSSNGTRVGGNGTGAGRANIRMYYGVSPLPRKSGNTGPPLISLFNLPATSFDT